MNRSELLEHIQAILEEAIDGMQWVSEKRKPYYMKARASEILDMIEGFRSEIEEVKLDWMPIRTLPVKYEHGTWYRDGDVMMVYTMTSPPIFPTGFEYAHSTEGFCTNPHGSYKLIVEGWGNNVRLE